MSPPVSNPNSSYKENNKYVGFDISNTPRYHRNEENYLFRTHFLKIGQTKHSEGNIGLTLYTGEYTVCAVEEYQGKYGYYGIGPELNANVFFSIYMVDIGLGIYAACIWELGDYLQFRIDSDNDGLADNHKNKSYGHGGLYPIIKFHLTRNSILTWQCGIGIPSDTIDSTGMLSPSLSYRHEHYNAWIGWIPFIRDEDGNNLYKYGSFSLGAGYKF